ncbi:hypothetical protein BC941DRAFT_433355 [Chlamydoabsidia padenii]|nr:hypothetical protein BC941DRAFT_433355 [Chlamydoabsidia padenii]
MSYSFDFGAQVTRICMDEIRRRGLDERKILRKSAPNSILLLKVFRQQNCTADDLIPVSIHSVATLMQDTLWCCHERIVPKKVWRIINYETCTLPNLSKVLTKKGETLLIEILDFLVEVMQHKANNLMDAYHLGEAMGKVTLGPADCDPIIAEKAGHFMTRMIIEHSKWLTQIKRPQSSHLNHYRFSAPVILSTSSTSSASSYLSTSSSSASSASSVSSTSIHLLPTSFSSDQEEFLRPMSKNEAAKAKAKSYNRLIQRIKNFNVDWINFADVGLRAMLDDDYELEPVPKEEPWISIFASHLDPKDANTSPLLYRIMSQATLEEPPVPSDPFASSYWFQHRHSHPVLQTNQSGGPAFSEFAPLIQSIKNHQYQYQHPNNIHASQWQEKEKASKSHLQKINHSLSNMKNNLRKKQASSPHMEDNGSGFSDHKDDSMFSDVDSGIQRQDQQPSYPQKHNQLPPLPQQQQQKLPEQELQLQSPPLTPPHSRPPPPQQRQLPHLPSTNSIQRQYDDTSSTKDQQSLLSVGSKHNQVKNIMRRVIKIGNTGSGSSIKKTIQA